MGDTEEHGYRSSSKDESGFYQLAYVSPEIGDTGKTALH